MLNGRSVTIGGGAYDFPGYNPICIAGPQMNKKIMRSLQQIAAHRRAADATWSIGVPTIPTRGCATWT